MIKIGNSTVSGVTRQLYQLIRPNVSKLLQHTQTGNVTARELLHLVVFLANKPAAFSFEVKRTIRYEILTQIAEEYDGERQAIAQHGLRQLNEQMPWNSLSEQRLDHSFDALSPLPPPPTPGVARVKASTEEIPPSHHYSLFPPSIRKPKS